MSTILEVSEEVVRLVDHRKVTVAEVPIDVDTSAPIKMLKVQRGFTVWIESELSLVPMKFCKIQSVVWTGDVENHPDMLVVE